LGSTGIKQEEKTLQQRPLPPRKDKDDQQKDHRNMRTFGCKARGKKK